MVSLKKINPSDSASPRIIELAGSPREIGRRHGELLAGDIREMRRALLTYISRVSLYVGTLPVLTILQLLARLSFWPHIPPRLREELQGLATGARLALTQVLVINALDDMANNWPCCSGLAAGDGRTTQGFYLAGRNLDYPVFVDALVDHQTLFLITPEEGLSFASLAWPGYVGAITAMNRAGVALAQLTAFCRDSTLRGLPAGLRNRLVLEQEATLEGVAARLRTSPTTIGNNLLLVSPREALVIEVSAHRHAIRRPAAGLLTVANHFESKAMASVKRTLRQPPPLSVLDPYHFTEAYSQSRIARMAALAAGRTLGPAEIQAILADPGVANAGTVNSVVFQPEDLTLWVAKKGTRPVSRGEYIHIKIG